MIENRIAVILPVRDFGTDRHKRLIRCLDSYREMTEGLSDVYVLHDDDECHIYEPLLKKYPEIKSLCIKSGINLMEKINVHAVDIANKYKYLGFVGDDIVFRTKWEKKFIQYLSEFERVMVYANDLVWQDGALATHPFITSNMVRALGFFGCPAVGHHFFDNYWMEMLKRVGSTQFMPFVIMEHFHPVVGKELQDSAYHQIESKFDDNHSKYLEYMTNSFESDVKKVLMYKKEQNEKN